MDRTDLQRLSKDELIDLVIQLQRPDKTPRTSSKRTHPTGAAGNLRHRRFGDQAATVAAIWCSASCRPDRGRDAHC
jgi:hypothetical protein